jgi:16S rRNA G966 N2-methylase RsmD
MKQEDIVKKILEEGKKTIKEISQETNIVEPNIRRILGVGTKKGIFERVDKGVYVLKTEKGEERAYIRMGMAQDALPKMAESGKKFDMIFLDPAYFSRALIGGNRGIKQYSFIMPDQFAVVMKAVKEMLRNEDSHVYLMLSGAPSAQKDMQKYVQATIDSGLTFIAEGGYKKHFQNGKPVTNVRGLEASAERLILFTKSGLYRTGEITELQMNFNVQRPAKKGYSTEKAEDFVERIVLQSTLKDEEVLDPFAGSGVVGKMSIKLDRKVTLVECQEETIENYIVPKMLEVI